MQALTGTFAVLPGFQVNLADFYDYDTRTVDKHGNYSASVGWCNGAIAGAKINVTQNADLRMRGSLISYDPTWAIDRQGHTAITFDLPKQGSSGFTYPILLTANPDTYCEN